MSDEYRIVPFSDPVEQPDIAEYPRRADELLPDLLLAFALPAELLGPETPEQRSARHLAAHETEIAAMQERCARLWWGR